MRSGSRSLLFALAPVCFFSARIAPATERVPFYLEYLAPSTCPDESAWLAALASRSSRVARVSDEAAPSLRVLLTEDSGKAQAELTAVDLDGRVSVRTLSASDCAEAVQGSAWISALWLDPSASEPPPLQAIDLEMPTQRALEPPRGVIELPEQNAVSTPPASSKSDAPLPLHVGASIQVGDFFSALPGSPLGFAGFLELSAWRRSIWAPLLRLGYVSAGSGVGSTERGEAHVRLATFRALGCVFEWPREAWVSLRPCAVWELGQLSASGEQTAEASKATAKWHTLGALGRASFEVFPLVSIDAEAGLIFPLVRDRFVFGPEPVVTGYATPALGGTMALGITIGAAIGDSARSR